MSAKINSALFGIVVAAVWLVACASSGAEATPETANVTITANDFSYSPATITVRAGQRVHLNFKNEGQVIHEIDFVGLKEGTKAEPGETNGANFTAPQAGVYAFECNIPGHKEAGMVGKLIVR